MLKLRDVIEGINGYKCTKDTLIKRVVTYEGQGYRDYHRVGDIEDVMYYGPDEGDDENWIDELLDAEVEVIHFDHNNKQQIIQINLV
jgi:hypothetical protein